MLSIYFNPQPLEASLFGLEEFLGDRSPARNRVAADLEQTIQNYFDTESGPQGKWQDLAPATLEEKRRKGYDMRILHRTLALREGIAVTASDSGNLGIIEAASDLDYAATMHFGDTRDAFGTGVTVTIPARPFLDVDERTEDRYERIYLDSLDRAWEASGASLTF